MRFSFLFLLALMVLGFVAAFLIRRSTASRSRVTEPSCGKCGYCVRGLESLVCPECGSDLREVGILTPGTHKPLSPKMRLLAWTLFAPLPGFLLAQMLSQWVTPWVATTQLQRVIFVQAEKLNTTIRAVQVAEEPTLGRGRAGRRPNAAMQTMTLKLEGGWQATTSPASPATDTLAVDLANGASFFDDGNGKRVANPGPFDAAVIEKWLNARGFTDPSATGLSRDIFAAVQEIGTPAGQGFTRLSPNPRRGGLDEITAHPAFGGFTTYTPTRFGQLIPFAVMLFVWLLGIPIVLWLGRRRPPTAGLSALQSARDADQA